MKTKQFVATVAAMIVAGVATQLIVKRIQESEQ